MLINGVFTILFILLNTNGILAAPSSAKDTCPEPTRCMVISECEKGQEANFIFPCEISTKNAKKSDTVCCNKRIDLQVVHLDNKGILAAPSLPKATCPEPTRCMAISECEKGQDTNFMFPCEISTKNSKISDTVCCNKRIELQVVQLENTTTPTIVQPSIISRSNVSNTSISDDNLHLNFPTNNLLPELNHTIDSIDDDRLFPEDCGLSLGNRISNGENATIGEHPWMALLGYTMPSLNILQFFCGGSLINNRYVLTAAHCIHLQGVKLTTVRLGENNIETSIDCTSDEEDQVCADPVVDVPIEKIIIHSKYGKSTKNDIALLRLSRKVKFTDYIRPVCLPFNITLNKTDYVNKTYTISGWGKLTGDSFMGSSVLQTATVFGWNSTRCNAAVPPNLRPIAETQLCAAGLQGQDSCKGDSGGPLTNVTHSDYNLLSRHYQIGIVSLGLGITCGNIEVPSVYTKVPKYLKWIEDNVVP